MIALYYSHGPYCTCPTVDSECSGCVYARYAAFLRGWSWIAIALEARIGGIR